MSSFRCIFCNSTQHTYRNCPVAYQKQKKTDFSSFAKKDYVGKTPNVFVGQYGYPSVNVGLLNVEEYNHHDDPVTWSKENYDIARISSLRSSLVNARSSLNIKSPSLKQPTGFSSRFLELAKEITLAKKPADVEINLDKKPIFKTSFDTIASPHGPNVGLKKASLTNNLSINKHLEKASYDTDLKSSQALTSLFKKGVNEHDLTKAFSVGNFGLERNRTLVPTRWSITAVDDTLSKDLIKKIKESPQGDCTIHIGGHLGNYYAILFFDDMWQYELFEQFVVNGVAKFVEKDYESYNGRTSYAEETAGGYYATRLPILEHLLKKRRQNACLVLRIITPKYTTPLGVWVVREAVRKTLRNKPLTFSNRQEMINYAKQYLQEAFNYNIQDVLKQSKLLTSINEQTKLSGFFKK